jgi:nitrate reductase NapD
MVISSLIVEVKPQAAHQAKLALEACPGVEVHEVRGHQIVVTIEADSIEASHARASSFVNLPGVLNVNLVYFNCEDEAFATAERR